MARTCFVVYKLLGTEECDWTKRLFNSTVGVLAFHDLRSFTFILDDASNEEQLSSGVVFVHSFIDSSNRSGVATYWAVSICIMIVANSSHYQAK